MECCWHVRLTELFPTNFKLVFSSRLIVWNLFEMNLSRQRILSRQTQSSKLHRGEISPLLLRIQENWTSFSSNDEHNRRDTLSRGGGCDRSKGEKTHPPSREYARLTQQQQQTHSTTPSTRSSPGEQTGGGGVRQQQQQQQLVGDFYLFSLKSDSRENRKSLRYFRTKVLTVVCF